MVSGPALFITGIFVIGIARWSAARRVGSSEYF